MLGENVITTCSANMPGIRQIFLHLSRLIGSHHIYSDQLTEVQKELRAGGKVLIFGGYQPDYFHLKVENVRVVVLWASTLGEMQLEPREWDWFNFLLDNPRVAAIWTGSEALAKVYDNAKLRYVPYPIKFNHTPLPNPPDERKGIMFFAPFTAKKNMLNNLAAVKLIPEKQCPPLYINSDEAFRAAKTMGIVNLIPSGWRSDENKLELMRSMNCLLNVSWAESFSYHAIEAALLGVPAIVSQTVKSVASYEPRFTVTDPNNPEEISEVIRESFKFKEDDSLSLIRSARSYSEYANQQCIEAFEELTEL